MAHLIMPYKNIRIGQVFFDIRKRDYYILAQTGPKIISLISLSDGNRFNDGFIVNDPFNISIYEWNEISKDNNEDINFELVSNDTYFHYNEITMRIEPDED